jgi:hypothetical protein
MAVSVVPVPGSVAARSRRTGSARRTASSIALSRPPAGSAVSSGLSASITAALAWLPAAPIPSATASSRPLAYAVS